MLPYNSTGNGYASPDAAVGNAGAAAADSANGNRSHGNIRRHHANRSRNGMVLVPGTGTATVVGSSVADTKGGSGPGTLHKPTDSGLEQARRLPLRELWCGAGTERQAAQLRRRRAIPLGAVPAQEPRRALGIAMQHVHAHMCYVLQKQ